MAAHVPYPLPPQRYVVHQFPLPTWIENIAIRPNGALLLSVLTPGASLYQIANPTSANPTVSLIHTFAEVGGLVGIAETTPDVFVVAGATFTSTGANGSTTVFSLDFRDHDVPVIKTIASMPSVLVPNGISALPDHPTAVLLADSFGGQAWRIDTLTGSYEVALQVDEMAPSAGGVGINGLHVYAGHLYFTNSGSRSLFRTRISHDGKAISSAAVETVAVLDAVFVDDFAIAREGTIYLQTNRDNRVIAIKPEPRSDTGYGKPVVVAGAVGSMLVAGNTAAAFGRTQRDDDILYVVTSGALSAPVNGTGTEGGKVVAIDTTRC